MVLTMRVRLVKEASISAKQSGERGIGAKHVKKVTEVSKTVQSFINFQGNPRANALNIVGLE